MIRNFRQLHRCFSTVAKNKRVLVAVANGSEEIELSSIVDVLRRAEVDVTIAKVDKNGDGCTNNKLSTLMHGMKVEADEVLDEDLLSNDFDAVVMPGGLPGSQYISDNAMFVDTLKKYMADDSKIVGSICATPAVVLSHHGLLEGYDSVTCYPYFAP